MSSGYFMTILLLFFFKFINYNIKIQMNLFLEQLFFLLFVLALSSQVF